MPCVCANSETPVKSFWIKTNTYHKESINVMGYFGASEEVAYVKPPRAPFINMDYL